MYGNNVNHQITLMDANGCSAMNQLYIGNLLVFKDVYNHSFDDTCYISSYNGNLQLHTTYSVNTNGVYDWASDARLKENIQELGVSNRKGGESKSMIDDIKVYSFTRKDLADKNHIHYGVLAQELQEILPELVDDGLKIDNSDETYLGVNYIELIPLLIDKCHRQDKIIKEQDARITELEKQMSQLMELLNNKK